MEGMVALSSGYANPAQMELQMKAICEGRTTRNDVVQQNLDQYRAVFNRTVQQINVLKSVSHDILRALCVGKVD